MGQRVSKEDVLNALRQEWAKAQRAGDTEIAKGIEVAAKYVEYIGRVRTIERKNEEK